MSADQAAVIRQARFNAPGPSRQHR